MRLRIQQPTAASNGCRDLSREAGVTRLRRNGSRFVPRRGDKVLNWGSHEHKFPDCYYINKPSAVAVCSNKLATYNRFTAENVPHAEWTTDHSRAQYWCREQGRVILGRTLSGHGGSGIHVYESGATIDGHALYVQYVPKYDEYRVHVWDGEVIDIQMKRRRQDNNGQTDANSRIRNAARGWVFCRERIDCPRVVIAAAKAAVRALDLDFGAADVGFTRRGNCATVYEVNSAPGIEGTTLRKYADRLCNVGRYRANGGVV